MLLRSTVLLSVCALGACSLSPERPAPPALDQQAAFSSDYALFPDNTGERPAWWLRVVAASITRQLQQAIAASPSLRRADEDINAARAVLRQATADTGPEISASADARVQQSTGEERSNSRAAGLDASLPVDISGSLQARKEAAQRSLIAVQADAAQLRSDLARDLLIGMIDAAEAGQRRLLLDQQTALASKLLRLIELRFTQGLATGVDVLQQRDQLAALRQQLPVADLDARRATNQLRRFSGITPDRGVDFDIDTLPDIRDRFDAVRPIDLLARRAALRAQQSRLEAADASFAAALADRWPQFSLSAGLLSRVVAGDASNLVSAAIDAALTLFDGGRKVAVADQRRAQLAAAGHQLLDDWISAVTDADTLIQAESSLQERIRLSDQRLENADALLVAAQRRYERGVSDYLPVLEALRSLQQQQRDHLSLQAELARTRVRLHHALGDRPQGDKA